MTEAQKNPPSKADYLDYLKLDTPPFARLDETAEVFHAEQYAFLVSSLANASNETGHLVLLRGVDGCGKTTLLNHFLSGLDEESYFVSIDESCRDALQFHCLFLEQIGFRDIEGKLEELQGIAQKFLVHRAAAGDALLLVIDNAHKIHPAVLEQVRALASITHEDRPVISIVLAGNSKLESIVNSPAMTELSFPVRVDFHIRAFTEQETADYIRHRLMLAGIDGTISFAPKALALIHRFTGGIPRTINRVSTLLLETASEHKTHTVSDAFVRTVAKKEQLPANVFPLGNYGRRKSDVECAAPAGERDDGEYIRHRESPTVYSEEEAAVLLAKIADACQTIESQSLEIEQLQEKLTTQTRESESLAMNSELEAAQLLEKIAELAGEVQSLEVDKAEDRKTIQSQHLEIDKLQESLAAESQESETLAASLEADAARLQEKISDLTAQVEGLQADNAEATQAISAQNLEIEELQESLAAQSHESESLAASLEADATRLQEKISELSAQVESLEVEKAEDRKTIQSQHLEIDKLQESLAAESQGTETLTASLEADAARLQEKIAELSAQVESLEADNAEATRAISAQNLEIEELQESLNRSAKDAKSIAASLSKQEREAASARTKATRTEKRLDRLKESKSKLQQTATKLRADLREAKQKATRLKNVEKRLEKSNEEKRELVEKLKELETLRHEIVDREETIAELMNTLESITTSNTGNGDQKGDGESGTDQKNGRIAALEVSKRGKVRQVLGIGRGRSRVMVGRSEDSDLRIQSKFVSRHHALIFADESGCRIEDLNSSNGTIVNGRKASRRKLRLDDEIIIGDFHIRPLPDDEH